MLFLPKVKKDDPCLKATNLKAEKYTLTHFPAFKG